MMSALAHRAVTAAVRAQVDLPVSSASGPCRLVTFSGLSHADHFALVFGELSTCPLVRVHSECVTGDVFGSLRCDCGTQLDAAISRIEKSGGAILYLRQEGRGIGLAAKIDAYLLQQEGVGTFEANRRLGFPEDPRDYRDAAEMLRLLGVGRIELLTNNRHKSAALEAVGITVARVVPCPGKLTAHNAAYLREKRERDGITKHTGR